MEGILRGIRQGGSRESQNVCDMLHSHQNDPKNLATPHQYLTPGTDTHKLNKEHIFRLSLPNGRAYDMWDKVLFRKGVSPVSRPA
jgi:hypothetical protein